LAKLLTLQVARGVAANLVVISHLSVVDAKYAGGALPPFAFYGIAGVDLFFVLSGFVMVAIAGRDITAGQFIWRRAARIYPAYWVVSLVVLAVSLVFPTIVNSSIQGPISIWRSFLLVPQENFPLLAVGWTLIHEMYFYLVFALLLFFRIPVPTGLVMWSAFLILCAVLSPPNYIAASPALLVLMSPLTAEFMMGAMVGVLYRHGATRWALGVGTAGLLAIAIAILFAAPALSLAKNTHLDAWRVVLFGVPAGLIVYALAAWELRTSPQAPAILVALGDWSYATYLVHVLVLSALGRLIALVALPGIGATLVLTGFGIVATNLAGGAMFWFFERPLLHRLHKIGQKITARIAAQHCAGFEQ
jgi:exopolysaccharide production protein ExoZ